MPEDVCVNISLLKRLRFQVLSDLDNFVPKGQFKAESSISYNGKILSQDEKWGLLALGLAVRLHYEAESHIISVSPRQSVAIELVEHLGNLASIECANITEPDRSEVINSLRTSLKEYLVYLPEQEQEPFIPLLQKEPEVTLKTIKQNQSVSGKKVNKQRRDILDPAIDEAINRAGNKELADVYLRLKELAKDEYPPFTGVFKGNALCYTNSNDELAELSKDALRHRLNRRLSAENRH